jgi:IS5 family transposase
MENLQIYPVDFMLQRTKHGEQVSLFFSLEDTLNPRHSPYILADKTDRQIFEERFPPFYSRDNGCSGKSVRLMAGLSIPKHVRDLSDESIVKRWGENSYRQSFRGNRQFTPAFPCEAFGWVRFRYRTEDSGCRLILEESIRINGKDGKENGAIAATTVQEKIACPFFCLDYFYPQKFLRLN